MRARKPACLLPVFPVIDDHPVGQRERRLEFRLATGPAVVPRDHDPRGPVPLADHAVNPPGLMVTEHEHDIGRSVTKDPFDRRDDGGGLEPMAVVSLPQPQLVRDRCVISGATIENVEGRDSHAKVRGRMAGEGLGAKVVGPAIDIVKDHKLSRHASSAGGSRTVSRTGRSLQGVRRGSPVR